MLQTWQQMLEMWLPNNNAKVPSIFRKERILYFYALALAFPLCISIARHKPLILVCISIVCDQPSILVCISIARHWPSILVCISVLFVCGGSLTSGQLVVFLSPVTSLQS